MSKLAGLPDHDLDRMIKAHLDEMLAWAEGRRSYTNYGPHEPYTPDAIARMDAAEVEKHANAIRGLVALVR